MDSRFCGKPCFACVKRYSAFIQLCSDGLHQRRHRGGGACDVGGAGVDHGCAALGAEMHLHPHRDSESTKQEEMDHGAPGFWMAAHTHRIDISPFHGDFPLARLSGVHIIKVSGVVVWVGAAEDQLSAGGVFRVPENIQSITLEAISRPPPSSSL